VRYVEYVQFGSLAFSHKDHAMTNHLIHPALAPRRSSRHRHNGLTSFFDHTELIVYVLAVLGVFVAYDLESASSPTRSEALTDKTWLYITLLTVGYMISRGLARSGSHEHCQNGQTW